jgi:hypothetical protein
MEQPDRVHFVGSIALDTVDDVFKTCGRTLGRRLKRLPDGEPGGRRLWVSWQIPVLRASPYLRQIGDGQVPLELVPGVSPEDIRFGELGYSREARVSYQDFCAARERGDVPTDVRFQVSLPTPFAVICPFVQGDGMFAVLAAYEKAMINEVEAICAAVPHEDLAIQWDVCIEMVAWDGQPNPFVPPVEHKERVIPPPIAKLCDAIPKDVEVGIHLCYGDYDAKHFIEPVDATKMVELANAIAEAADHTLAWLHLPVPVSRHDDAFFEPLRDLNLDPDTEIYLGLVHEDGAEATRRRISSAKKVLPDFGIATECGIARQRTPERVEKLIRIHAESSVEPAGHGALS